MADFEEINRLIQIKVNEAYKKGHKEGMEYRKEITEGAMKEEYQRGYKDALEAKEIIALSAYCDSLNAALDRGYDQGYNDCKVELLEDEAKCHYQEGYNDGYRKGVEHGKEARVAEADCAYQCGLRRAWEVARKILSRHGEGYDATDREVFGTDDVFSLSASEAVSKLEAWEKKQKQEQEQSKKRCENCDHYCGYDNKFKCDINGVLCIERDRWTPKQDAPKMNVGSRQFLQLTSRELKNNEGYIQPYYEIEWLENGEKHVGYGSFKLECVLDWLAEYFGIYALSGEVKENEKD